MDSTSKNNEVNDEANAAAAMACLAPIAEKYEINNHPTTLPKMTTSKMNKVNFHGRFPALRAV
jgi:hypothetical protein